MSRRAQQSAGARCPWCQASLPQRAVECPACLFPLTMAATADGARAAEPSGTSSTATSARHPHLPPTPGGRYDPDRARVLRSRVHRLRIVAWLLGLSTLLLLAAGIAAMVTASSPGARSDREAIASLNTALHRATDQPDHRPETVITPLPGDTPSDQPTRVSTAQAQGFWFGAARSTSGRCYLLAARASNAEPLGRGTLSDDEPCSAAQVRFHLERKLVEADRPPGRPS